MPSLARLARFVLYSLLFISFPQTPPQGAASGAKVTRIRTTQEHLCCFILNFVAPIYPRESRLAHTEGAVKVIMVIAVNGTVADLQAVSGDPLLVDSTIKAVRQWRFQPYLLNAEPVEAEVPLSFTFSIHDAPKPAYLHFTNGDVIRADEVREDTDKIEYRVGRRTHRISPESVTAINTCARITILGKHGEGDCVPGGAPYFNIRAMPLLPAGKADQSDRPTSP